MLAVGRLEKAYTSIRNRVILSFFGIATIGFICVIGMTYREIGNIMLPVGKMVAATRNIAAGRFDQEVQSSPEQGEIALLADSFNTMLKSLRQMRSDLEEWGRTLEEKVKQRSEELGVMQARVAQSERLASLGILAAGVAHEINNPLGAIMALTALTLEDVRRMIPAGKTSRWSSGRPSAAAISSRVCCNSPAIQGQPRTCRPQQDPPRHAVSRHKTSAIPERQRGHQLRPAASSRHG